MTPTQAFLAAVITALSGSGFWRYFGPKLIEWKNRKEIALKRQNEADEKRRQRERDQWMRESKEAYSQVKSECRECQEKLEAVKKTHEAEIRVIRRELADVKEALLDRIEALDEIIPYITNLPDEKVRELRASNRAHRQAAFRTF